MLIAEASLREIQIGNHFYTVPNKVAVELERLERELEEQKRETAEEHEQLMASLEDMTAKVLVNLKWSRDESTQLFKTSPVYDAGVRAEIIRRIALGLQGVDCSGNRMRPEHYKGSVRFIDDTI